MKKTFFICGDVITSAAGSDHRLECGMAHFRDIQGHIFDRESTMRTKLVCRNHDGQFRLQVSIVHNFDPAEHEGW